MARSELTKRISALEEAGKPGRPTRFHWVWVCQGETDDQAREIYSADPDKPLMAGDAFVHCRAAWPRTALS